MQTTLENKKKAIVDSSKSAFKRKNIVEEGRTLGSIVKRKQESIEARAHKMMRGRVEPFAVPTMVHVAKHIIEAPHMMSPQEGLLREQKQEVPQMTFPQEKHLKEQRQEVKMEHDTRFLKGDKHLHFDDDIYEDWMETTTSS